ncbi:uncharacterized protein PHALS_15043 [Plasmopara halstedii]|uniref:Uncharacterized protein n=1 Tax=Plasmopara halstedii TaxID=4781 RepID=A0A0P1AAJ9_PLAHL|nr:uncharacterized protein PHALS_15043 [Plasmopara halstedii]CEG37264.1 hypothetical protein PHALS_15043 [Plasmopara halstedii]|eukprot:XP_024573633.1 hypothetical protein PHALS_15043 [Plasmopara halstedii]
MFSASIFDPSLSSKHVCSILDHFTCTEALQASKNFLSAKHMNQKLSLHQAMFNRSLVIQIRYHWSRENLTLLPEIERLPSIFLLQLIQTRLHCNILLS